MTDDVLSGILTREKWLEWQKSKYSATFSEMSDSEQKRLSDDISFRLGGVYSFYFRHTLFVCENFFILSEGFRWEIEFCTRELIPFDTLEQFVTLALQLESQGYDLDFENHTGRADTLLRPLVRSVSDDFDKHLFDFRVCYVRDTSTRKTMLHNSPSICNSIVLMLAILYGESLTERVLWKWIRGECPGTIAEFATTVKYVAANDVEDLLEYPIEWIANLVRGGKTLSDVETLIRSGESNA